MKIGTIGAGHIAKAFTKHVAAAGHDIVMTNKSDNSALNSIVKEFGSNVRAGNLE